MIYKYFVYDEGSGFETFKTEQEAKTRAQDAANNFRSNVSGGWGELVSNIVWGEVKQGMIEIGCGHKVEFEGEMVDAVDYQLQDI